MVTGSPASAWQPNISPATARWRPSGAATSRSVAHSTHGSSATLHDMFGKLPVEMTGPDTEKTIAPIAAAGPENLVRNSR